MKEHTDKLMINILAKTKGYKMVKAQQFFYNDGVLESVVEERDYNEEQKSHFEAISNIKIKINIWYTPW